MMDSAAQKAAVKNSRLAALPDMNDPQGNATFILDSLSLCLSLRFYSFTSFICNNAHVA